MLVLGMDRWLLPGKAEHFMFAAPVPELGRVV